MKCLETLRDGIGVANKNWQLVIVQFLFMAMSFLILLVVVGVPLGIAFILFGIDLTEILRQHDIAGVLHIFLSVLKEYFAVVLFVAIAFVIYLLAIAALWIFTFAGTVGSLARTILSGQAFSLVVFFAEGRRLFFPVFFFVNLAFFCFGLLAAILGIMSESAKRVITLAESHEATLAVFLGIFFMLVLILVGAILLVLVLGMTLYGLAALVFGRPRAFRSLRQGLRFLIDNPSGLVFLGVLVMAYLLAGTAVITFTSILVMIPMLGGVLAMPFQFLSQAAHAYAIIVIIASIFLFYFRNGLVSSQSASRQESGISQTPAAPQDPAPADSVPPEQV